VIDAQRAGVPHVLAQRVDERAVALRAQPVGTQRRQAPVLAVRVEFVGRGADARERPAPFAL